MEEVAVRIVRTGDFRYTIWELRAIFVLQAINKKLRFLL